MNKEWRPADWNTKTPFSFDVSKVTFEAGASAMLTARDKWWIEKMQMLGFIPTDHEILHEYHNRHIHAPDCVLCRWESFKKELNK